MLTLEPMDFLVTLQRDASPVGVALTDNNHPVRLTAHGNTLGLGTESGQAIKLSTSSNKLWLQAAPSDALSMVLVPALRGEQGPPGADGDKNYPHVQGVASAEWIIDHNLDKYPSVTVVDSAGTEVIGEVRHVSEQRVILNFAAAFAGRAYLN